MDLSKVPLSERPHIAFFGCTNAGKSSLVNAFCNQALSIVSDKKGTTTDPVKKSMELLPFGPVVIIDTPGFDDETALGELRVSKTNEVLGKADVAVLVVDSYRGILQKDNELIELFTDNKIPYIIAFNKADLVEQRNNLNENEIYVSAIKNENIKELKDIVGKYIGKIQNEKADKFIIADRLNLDDSVVLVIPIDESAPKGRLILPQQLVLRELLDSHHSIVCVQVSELETIINNFKIKPKLVITDSQAFEQVKQIVPEDILLTSFSILFANYKGNLKKQVEGAKKISQLNNGDIVLISEGCTHHRQCNDIGTVKFPKWLKEFTGKDLEFEFTSGDEFPQDLNKYSLIIHCGGCMVNENEMKTRVKRAVNQNISMVNYGIAIAYMNGILERALTIFPEISAILETKD